VQTRNPPLHGGKKCRKIKEPPTGADKSADGERPVKSGSKDRSNTVSGGHLPNEGVLLNSLIMLSTVKQEFVSVVPAFRSQSVVRVRNAKVVSATLQVT